MHDDLPGPFVLRIIFLCGNGDEKGHISGRMNVEWPLRGQGEILWGIGKRSEIKTVRPIWENKTAVRSGGVLTAGMIWLPVCNPLHNRSLSPAVNRKPSISTGYQRSGRS